MATINVFLCCMIIVSTGFLCIAVYKSLKKQNYNVPDNSVTALYYCEAYPHLTDEQKYTAGIGAKQSLYYDKAEFEVLKETVLSTPLPRAFE